MRGEIILHTPQHSVTIAQLVSFMRSSRDTGILPEAMLRREALLAGSEWGVFHPATQGSSENLADRQALARYDEILKVAMAVAEDHPPIILRAN